MDESSAPSLSPRPPRRLAMIPLAIAVALTLAFIWLLRGVFTSVFLAFFIAYMLDPLVDRFEDRGLHRGVGIAALLCGTLAVLVVATVIILPNVAEEFAHFAAALPARVAALLESARAPLAEVGLEIPTSWHSLTEQLPENAGEVAQGAMGRVTSALGWFLGGTASAVGAIASAAMVPIIAFYLLYDFDRIVAAGGELVPFRHRELVFGMASEIDEVLGHWVRGQLLVMLVLFILYWAGYGLAGAPLAFPIALLAGAISFIPYVGSGLGLVLALVTCALAGKFWPSMGYVVIVWLAVQTLEGFVITPKIVGDEVGLSAIVVMLALMVGGELFGFLGILMAVPGAAVLKIFVQRAVGAYRRSELFGVPEDDSRTHSEADGEPSAAPDGGPEPPVDDGDHVDDVDEIEGGEEGAEGVEAAPLDISPEGSPPGMTSEAGPPPELEEPPAPTDDAVEAPSKAEPGSS